jgi:hypothetical protein
VTPSGLVVASALLIGVFALFWWLVELSGGLAWHAISVARSMQSGVVAWIDAQLERETEAEGVSGESSGPDPTGAGGSAQFREEGFSVPIQAVSGRHR